MKQQQLKQIFPYHFTVPHLFFMASSLFDNYIQITTCIVPYDGFWKNYLARYRPQLLENFPYSPFLLPLYEVNIYIFPLNWINITHSCFFQWVNLLQANAESFTDSFIMLLATGLATRFSQFNDLLRKMIHKDRDLMSAAMWKKMRMDYVQLIHLLRFIDSHVNVLTFVCIGQDAFLVAFKIFNIFRYVFWVLGRCVGWLDERRWCWCG